jgi:chromosome segregation ATPase
MANLQKNLRNLNSQLEEKENLIKNLSDKNFSYEDTLRSFNMTNKSYKLNLDNLVGQIENLEKEIKNLNLTIKEKEELIRTEAELHNKTKSKLHEYENVFENFEVKQGGRCDRGRLEVTNYCYIPISYLNELESL